MKARITQGEFEGTAQEIATALQAILIQRTPQLSDERLQQIADEAIASDPPVEDAEIVEETRASRPPVFGVTSAADPYRDMVDAIGEVTGTDLSDIQTYPPVPEWSDIADADRRWAQNKNTLHLRRADDPSRVYCTSRALMPLDADVSHLPQAVSLAKVCGSCWRRKVEAGRP